MFYIYFRKDWGAIILVDNRFVKNQNKIQGRAKNSKYGSSHHMHLIIQIITNINYNSTSQKFEDYRIKLHLV